MKVSCGGLGRSCGVKRLLDRDISKTKGSEFEKAEGTEPIMVQSDEASLTIRWDARNIQLHGNYQIDVRLEKNEILNLMRVALGQESFDRVIDGLSGKKMFLTDRERIASLRASNRAKAAAS